MAHIKEGEGELGLPEGNQKQGVPPPAKSKTPHLDTFGKNLNKMAIDGKLDVCIGRDHEVERMVQILTRRKKNNPILVGNPGVGKTALAENLALRIVQKKVSRVLHNKVIINLDVNSIISGAMFRGQFEERMKAIIEELIENPEIIVFIDEIHTIIGSGNANHGLDVANILKPELARGAIKVIGSTTNEEFREIEKDKALERRFQKVQVDEPSQEETIQILNQIKFMYEDHHNVKFSDDAITTAVHLADRYITHRFFPDKAIDIIDEAGSRIRLNNMKLPNNIVELEKQEAELKIEKDKNVKLQEYEKAAKVRDKEKDLTRKLELAKSEWEIEEKKETNRVLISKDDITSVVAKMVKVPLETLSEDEGKRILKMADVLREQVIGQDEACAQVAEAIQVSKAGISDPRKPIASFLFLGSTGCGKTFLAQQLANYLFGDGGSKTKNILRLNMSEFSMPHTISNLIGSPKSFVGWGEGNILKSAMDQHSHMVIILDEIEKSHQDIQKLFLQILDEGHCSDADGNILNFKNTIIIMTSNVGSKELFDNKKLGFDTKNLDSNQEDVNSIIEKALKKKFAPEFLNRIDSKIFFNRLNENNIKDVVNVNVNKTIKDIKQQGYVVEVGDKLKSIITEKGYSEEYGARPLLRTIKEYVLKPLSKDILSSKIAKGDKVFVDWNDKKEEVIIKKK